MKLCTFIAPEDRERLHLGAILGDAVVHLRRLRDWADAEHVLPAEALPGTMLEFIHAGPATWDFARELLDTPGSADPLTLTAPDGERVAYALNEVWLYPPLPRPTSLRDFYAFEQHVATAYANRGRKVPAEWYQVPVFYFSNPNAIFGPEATIPYPKASQALDYELEVACVIGRVGQDIAPDQAEEFIFGYTIFNDWSARDLQRQEMRVGLGPAKGKDFASSLGPFIVTPDELFDRYTGRPGVYDLTMVARVNGEERSRGNWRDLHYSFGEMIARASADVFLFPGDVIGSGTVGTGCLLELTRGEGPWLQPGDVVELEIERLGMLRNRVSERNTPV